MTTPIDANYCFVCGQDNPRGLKISVTYREAGMAAETELALPREFQGWAGVIHGGILATLLDEMMAHAVWHFAGPGLTLGLEVRFHAPLKPEKPILRGAPHQNRQPPPGRGRGHPPGRRRPHRREPLFIEN
jgi:acyl-coenzyme A thioesterase PaaI-like protein